MGPSSLAPYDEVSLFAEASILEMTPLYIGQWRAQNVTYHSEGSKGISVELGGLIQPHGFSSAGSNLTGLDGASSRVLTLPTPMTPFTVGFIPGTSSWEFGEVLGTHHALNWMLKLENPRVEYWSPLGADSNSTTMYTSDGGNIDNVGLIGALQRRVQRIALHISTHVPLALRSMWDPSQPAGLANLTKNPVNTFIDCDLTGYFGVGHNSGTVRACTCLQTDCVLRGLTILRTKSSLHKILWVW